MPTGYTAEIIEKDGITFQQFAMNCARAFGALIEMRDQPIGAEVPEKFEASSYHVEAHRQAVKEVVRLSNMTTKKQQAFGEAKRRESIRDDQKYLAHCNAENEKFEAMRRKVEAWKPPTKDHVELKNFMLQQISISVSPTDSIESSIRRSEKRDPISFYTDALECAKRSVAYHRVELEKEKQRANDRTEWVQQLRKSLEVAP